MMHKTTLKDALEVLEKLGVDPSRIVISKEGLREIKEKAKDIACERLLGKKQ
jgi:hypothetical protein